MYLIVGLGNPELKYNDTRHNIGFKLIDNFLVSNNISIDSYKEKFNSMIYDLSVNSTRVILAKPLTYMNLSGKAVREIIDFYKIPLNNILIICDDIDLDFNKIRLRPSGSSGGHNGLKDIIKYLGTDEFNRLKIGVGKSGNTKDYVLSKFTEFELEELNKRKEIFENIILDFTSVSFDKLMNKYNNKWYG